MAEAPESGVWCCELELSGVGGVDSVSAFLPQHATARVLVRLHGEPLGYVSLPPAGGLLDRSDVVALAWDSLRGPISEHLGAEGLPVRAAAGVDGIPAAGPGCPSHLEASESVSVVVCTRDRSEILAQCLRSLQKLTYPDLEIVVVDNAPRDGATRDLVLALAGTDSRFRYAVEPRPGLSAARNRGLAEARGTLIAYTDDDVLVDSRWVEGLVRGFRRRPDVACVTGLVCTASVDSPAEAYFDSRASAWSARFRVQIFDMKRNRGSSVLYPFSPADFGTGANFAFDRRFLVESDGFDEALGAGALTRGGEDIDKFVDTLLARRAIAYEPSAIVWHRHRADRAGLLRQMYGYGTGLSAFITKYLVQRSTRWQVLRRIPAGLGRAKSIHSDVARGPEVSVAPPKGATVRELAGYATGPFLYARARRRVRRSEAVAAEPSRR